MANVYLTRISSYSETKHVSKAARALLETLLLKENVNLEKNIALKVHFGEHGNITYISPKNFDGIIGFLDSRKVRASFIETNAIYSGHRMQRDMHIALGKEHGFTRLPIIIADGDHGDEFDEVRIGKKHFASCKVGKAFSRFPQLIVMSHFKGHGLAGYGGAIK